MNIPTLPFGMMTDKEGKPTAEELIFRQNLITELQKGVGKFYYALPQVTAADIAVLESATIPNPSGGIMYATPLGATVFNVTANEAMYAKDNGSGAPIFVGF